MDSKRKLEDFASSSLQSNGANKEEDDDRVLALEFGGSHDALHDLRGEIDVSQQIVSQLNMSDLVDPKKYHRENFDFLRSCCDEISTVLTAISGRLTKSVKERHVQKKQKMLQDERAALVDQQRLINEKLKSINDEIRLSAVNWSEKDTTEVKKMVSSAVEQVYSTGIVVLQPQPQQQQPPPPQQLVQQSPFASVVAALREKNQ